MAQFSRTTSQIDAILDDVVSAKGTSASLTAAMSSVTAGQAADRTALVDIINSGAKNRANPLAAEGYSGQTTFPMERGGVKYTLNANGTITTSQSSTATTTLKIPVTLKIGETYTISGCPAGGSDQTYRLDLRKAGTSTVVANEYGSGATITPDQTNYDLCIRYPSGKPAAETFSPMICASAAYAITPDFVQYVPSNADLWAMIQAL